MDNRQYCYSGHADLDTQQSTPFVRRASDSPLSLSTAVCAAPEVGSVAPDFTLPSNTGKDIALKDLLKKAKHTVLYFYPGKGNQTSYPSNTCSDQHRLLTSSLLSVVRQHEFCGGPYHLTK